MAFLVIDQGNGIAEDLREQIFEPFFSSKQNGRMGLGLSITRSLVRAMGGNIKYESAAGTGAAFHIALPVRLKLANETLSAV